jgi:membrane protease YdiL (CAAX protease family)
MVQPRGPRTADGRLFQPPPPRALDTLEQCPVELAAETVLVTAGVLAALWVLSHIGLHEIRWFLIPGLLTVAALVPPWLTQREFPRFGFDREHIGLALGTVCRLSVYVLPMTFLALWGLQNLRLPIPLRPIIADRQTGLSWLLYQFLYVALAEEVFFRGYFQANVMRLLARARGLQRPTQERIAIVASAACFAGAHILVQGQALPILTFLPGLLLAWLFVQTRSLLASILFHGLANVSYGIMAITLA